ncbi:MAG: SDR family oxidoreductase [Synergistaceae bacterium]|jgi:NAD(P)-dependent dehydrogenase (short-subunit alcohol dehydrogenase family)|nr:SDR family oxidoreductase [Synergistaceae bacterium]
MGTLDGKTAFVTGAAMGNGEGIAAVMAEKGASVIMADLNDSVFETAKKIGAAAAYQTDVSDFAKVKEAACDAVRRFGKIDILVNNAGVARMIRVEDMSDELRDLHWRVNVVGCWNCVKAILPGMIERRYGRIVNMSSVTGPRVVDPGMMGYAISKAAIVGFTKAIAMDAARYGVTSNAILPGYFLTPMVMHSASETDPANPQRVLDGIARGVPLGRFGDPKEIGYLAAFLASDEAAYITGAEFVIDGGSTLPETGAMGVLDRKQEGR